MSDRLLTVEQHKKVSEFDAISNKTVVYRAKDALVTIGYSGLAQIENIPTDEWIAECLWGAPLPIGRDGKRPITFGNQRPQNWKIGYAVMQLQNKLTEAKSPHIDKHGIYITIAGWQEWRGGVRPLVNEISRIGKTTKLDRGARNWKDSENFCFYGIGAGADGTKLKAALEPFRNERGLNQCSPDNIEKVFSEFIRISSSKIPTIGANLLSVVLMRPGIGISGCQFLPVEQHLAQISTATGQMEISVAHTPWIVSEGLLLPLVWKSETHN